jgi:hypothetical protein
LVIFQAADVHDGRFAHQGQAIGAHHLVEELGHGALDLGDFLAAVAFVVGAGEELIGEAALPAIGLISARVRSVVLCTGALGR